MAKHLWGHVSTTHKGHPMVTCGLCQRTFSSVSNLEDHKRVKHKDEVLEQVSSISFSKYYSYNFLLLIQ